MIWAGKNVLVISMVVLCLSSCAYVDRKMEIHNALIDRPDLKGLSQERIRERFGLPETSVPIKSGHDQDETWIYRNKWYGVMSVRIIDGFVSDVNYQYGMLSR